MGLTADGSCGRAGVDLHLERAAVQDMLVEELLPPDCHCPTCHLHVTLIFRL